MAGASFPEAFMKFFSWRAAFAINFSNSIVPALLCQSPSRVPARQNSIYHGNAIFELFLKSAKKMRKIPEILF